MYYTRSSGRDAVACGVSMQQHSTGLIPRKLMVAAVHIRLRLKNPNQGGGLWLVLKRLCAS